MPTRPVGVGSRRTGASGRGAGTEPSPGRPALTFLRTGAVSSPAAAARAAAARTATTRTSTTRAGTAAPARVPTGTARGAARTPRPQDRAGAAAALPRMPFVLLVLGLLGGGLICLLVINTTLGATSFRVSQLQSSNTTLSQEEHQLQQQVYAEQNPAQIANRAYQLGMRPQSQLNFLNLQTRRIDHTSGQAGGSASQAGPGR